MTIYELPKYMIICLVCTVIIEISFAFILKIRKKDLLTVLLVNVLTNPLVVSISTGINLFHGAEQKRISMIFLEITAFLTEALIYKYSLDNKKINPFLLSLLLNLSSYGLGFLINIII